MIRFTINNHTTKLSGDPKILHNIFKHFQFKHPNAFHMRKKIKFKWDGMVNPVSKTGVIKTGLAQSVLDYVVNDLGIEDFEVVDYRQHLRLREIPDTIAGLTPRPYQKRCIENVIYNSMLDQPHQRGIILASMNAGKTIIMFGIHMSIVGAKTMILINNKVLYKQLKQDLAEAFPNTYGYMQGKNIQWGEIMVVMVQTLSNRLDEYQDRLKEFNVLLTDECDLADNKTFETVYRSLEHVPLRAGFTGTAFLRFLKKDQIRNTKMLEIFGSLLDTISMKDLEDMGVSTPIIIKLIRGNTRIRDVFSFNEEWDEAITFNRLRHHVIYDRVLFNLKMERKYIMIFCKFIDQVTETHQFLSERAEGRYTVGYAHHKSNYAQTLEDFKDGRLNILVCSLFLKRGLNLPLIQTIINGAGGDFYSAPLQIAGRGVRKHKSKKVVYLEDIQDKGKYLTKHSNQRIQYYKQQKLKIRDYR